MTPQFTYAARIVRVTDGDTVVVDVDLGMRITTRQPLRLLGIDAAELNTDAGKAARDALKVMLPEGATVVVRTFKNPTDKYGRWLAQVVTNAGVLVNQQLVADGHAVVMP